MSLIAYLQIIATGQTPQSELLQTLAPHTINDEKFVKTKPTLQIADDTLPNIFAVGDVAATKAHKAARPAMKQVALVVTNIQHMLKNESLEEYSPDPAGIHLTLGIEKSVVFRNPAEEGGEPYIMWKDDGTLDMNIGGVWKRRGGGDDAFL